MNHDQQGRIFKEPGNSVIENSWIGPGFIPITGSKNPENEWPDKGRQHGGRRMQTRRIHEQIDGQTQRKS